MATEVLAYRTSDCYSFLCKDNSHLYWLTQRTDQMCVKKVCKYCDPLWWQELWHKKITIVLYKWFTMHTVDVHTVLQSPNVV